MIPLGRGEISSWIILMYSSKSRLMIQQDFTISLGVDYTSRGRLYYTWKAKDVTVIIF